MPCTAQDDLKRGSQKDLPTARRVQSIVLRSRSFLPLQRVRVAAYGNVCRKQPLGALA